MPEPVDTIALTNRDFYRDAWAYVYADRYCIPYGHCLAVVLAGSDADPESVTNTDPDTTSSRIEPLH